jgi:hypothetical protein
MGCGTRPRDPQEETRGLGIVPWTTRLGSLSRGHMYGRVGEVDMNDMQPDPDQGAREFLLEDFRHFSESFWRNEEVGEKRFSFFVSLVTAVAGGLVALRTADKAHISDGEVMGITRAAVAALLVVGILSYLRMLHRNRTTDEYHRTLRYIRARLVATLPGFSDYEVPRTIDSWPDNLRAGYAETVGVLNGLLLAVLVWLLYSGQWCVAIGSGAALAAISWWLACDRQK